MRREEMQVGEGGGGYPLHAFDEAVEDLPGDEIDIYIRGMREPIGIDAGQPAGES